MNLNLIKKELMFSYEKHFSEEKKDSILNDYDLLLSMYQDDIKELNPLNNDNNEKKSDKNNNVLQSINSIEISTLITFLQSIEPEMPITNRISPRKR